VTSARFTGRKRRRREAAPLEILNARWLRRDTAEPARARGLARLRLGRACGNSRSGHKSSVRVLHGRIARSERSAAHADTNSPVQGSVVEDFERCCTRSVPRRDENGDRPRAACLLDRVKSVVSPRWRWSRGWRCRPRRTFPTASPPVIRPPRRRSCRRGRTSRAISASRSRPRRTSGRSSPRSTPPSPTPPCPERSTSRTPTPPRSTTTAPSTPTTTPPSASSEPATSAT
jgi:hypothetical protein